MMISKLADLIESYMRQYGLNRGEAAKAIKHDLNAAREILVKRQRPREGSKG